MPTEEDIKAFLSSDGMSLNLLMFVENTATALETKYEIIEYKIVHRKPAKPSAEDADTHNNSPQGLSDEELAFIKSFENRPLGHVIAPGEYEYYEKLKKRLNKS